MGRTLLNWLLLIWLREGGYVVERIELLAPTKWSNPSRVLDQALDWPARLAAAKRTAIAPSGAKRLFERVKRTWSADGSQFRRDSLEAIVRTVSWFDSTRGGL